MENPLRPLLAALLSAAVAIPAAANRGRVSASPASVSSGQGGVVPSGAAAGTSAAAPGQTAPALLPSALPNPIDPVVLKEAESIGVEPAGVKRAVIADPAAAVAGPVHAAPEAILAPAARTVRLPASALKTGNSEPNIPGAIQAISRESAANGADEERENSTASPETTEGGHFFDGARRIGASLVAPLSGALHRLRRGWKGEDKVPGFPGAVGDGLRIDGKRYELHAALSAPEGQALYADRKAGHEPTLLRFYSAEQAERYEFQRAALLELAKTDIPHNRLLASNDAHRVLVQESFEQSGSFALRAGKDMSYSQWTALPDLFYKLIERGKAVDLSAENLKWSHWRGHWAIQDAETFEDGAAWDVLGQWLFGATAQSYGADPVELLRALRGRFGPDSPSWKRIVSEGREIADAKRLLDALGRQDAARPPPPSLRFSRAAASNDWLQDKLVSEGEMKRRFGFSPLSEKGANLHFDKGKLNTSIMEIGTEENPWVRKISSEEIIRNELFLRKVVHRWFGEYFDAPWSLARYNGYDSYMMMEKVGGSHWGRGRFSDAQRTALAILMNTFGVGDVNLGNIMSAAGSNKPVLIDFEQALSRKHPVTNRIPDEAILTEMPWVDAGRRVEPETYHRGIAQWRELFAAAETQNELRVMLRESGFSEDQTKALLARLAENVRNLTHTLQADIEFANYFHRDGR